MEEITVIGGGLAGCEAAWQAANSGAKIRLYEMRPVQMTEAHISGDLAELVCSNSLGSTIRNRASGLLKEECKLLNSLLVRAAEESALPAGDALAVDREVFSRKITSAIENHPNIEVIRQEVTRLPEGPVILATGPLTSMSMSTALRAFTGEEHLSFFDAIAPIVTAGSIDMNFAFRASRYKYETDPRGDYINCPFTETEYFTFLEALLSARRIGLKPNESQLAGDTLPKDASFFEACLPVEVMAARDPLVLTFGPMRPTGLRNPHTGERPYAVLQLRQDDLADSLYNMVGFQTNLLYPEQEKVFRLIPGLKHAEFVRFGQMHRNTYINAPRILFETTQTRTRPDLFIAGQLAGVEGYMGNIASGLAAGINAARFVQGRSLITFPRETMTGALLYYIANANPERFQPMKANLGLLTPLEMLRRSKQEKGYAYAKRALNAMRYLIEFHHLSGG